MRTSLTLAAVALAVVALGAQAPPLTNGVFIEDHGTTAVVIGTPPTVRTTAMVGAPGAQRTLILLVNFQDYPAQPYTIAEVQQIAFSTVSNWYRQSSFGTVWLEGDVVGWYTLPMASTVACDIFSMSTNARNAAMAAGVDVPSYQRYVYVFPHISACGWWGFGSVGGEPSQAWINGTLAVQSLAHEMGHNFGLYHAHSLQCGITELTPPCVSGEYGDLFDIMGWSALGDFDPFNKSILGWENHGTLIATVPAPSSGESGGGTYQLVPYADTSTFYKALRIPRPDGSNFFVEWRAGVGLLIRLGTDGLSNSGSLLDMTAANSAGYFGDAALPLGQSFVDVAGQITITFAALDPTAGALVRVAYGGAPPPPPPPPPPIVLYDFGLSAKPKDLHLHHGQTGQVVIALTEVSGKVIPPVAFTATLSAPDGSAIILPPSTVRVQAGAKKGRYTLTVQGVGGGQTHTLVIKYEVN